MRRGTCHCWPETSPSQCAHSCASAQHTHTSLQEFMWHESCWGHTTSSETLLNLSQPPCYDHASLLVMFCLQQPTRGTVDGVL
jgi:hypothetical protein